MTSEHGHRWRLVYIGAWGEWRPECECGWTGSYWRQEDDARTEALAHTREARA
jgi:hypothetical protein